MQTNRSPNPDQTKQATASAVSMERERDIGIWYGSKTNAHFWLMSIVTLSLYYWLIYRHNMIRLTTRRVMQNRGSLLTSNEMSLGISSVTNIDVNMSFLGRIFNYGDISIQSAGSDAVEIYFVRLANPVKLREAIFDLKDGKYDETKN